MCSCDLARGRFCPSHLATLKEFTQVAEEFAGSDRSEEHTSELQSPI